MDNLELMKSEPLSGYQELDDILKCNICHETIQTPMITSCSHTFCSLCIRKWLATKQVCPACSESIIESSLRKNTIVENIVQALNNAKKSKRIIVKQPQTPGPSTSKSSPQVLKKKERNTPVPKSEESSDIDDFVPKTKRSPPQTPKSCVKANHKENPPATPATPLSTPSLGKSPALVKAPCPSCFQEVPIRAINEHLDKCLLGDGAAQSSRAGSGSSSKNEQPFSPINYHSSQKAQKTSSAGNGLEPIKKLVINLLSDAQVRKELKKYGLPSQGDRKTIQSRLQRYVVMHNAECDSSNPRTLEELVKAFNKEEKALTAPPTKTFSQLFKTKQPDPEEFETCRKDYIRQNSNSFQALIQQVKRRGAMKKNNQALPNEDSENKDPASKSSESACASRMRRDDAESKSGRLAPVPIEISDSEEEDIDPRRHIETCFSPQRYSPLDSSSDSEEGNSVSKSTSLPTKPNLKRPVADEISDSEEETHVPVKGTPHENKLRGNVSRKLDKTPQTHRNSLEAVKRKVQCIESESEEENDRCARPEKRASLEGSPVLARKTPVRRELRSRPIQNKKASDKTEPPARRSQRKPKNSAEDNKQERQPTPDLFGTPPSPASSEITCGQKTRNNRKHEDSDDALSQLVSMMENDDSGSSTDFES